MLKKFISYFKIGILNTGVHWVIFLTLFNFSISQSISNLIAFLVAMSLSFVLNAKYTFDKKATVKGYFLFATFMALLSYLCGYLGDTLKLNPIITLILFSGVSLVIGFLYSKLVVFK